MKLCKNCKHCKLDSRSELSRCTHPTTETTRVSLISGEDVKTFKSGANSDPNDFLPFCESVRGVYGFCGDEAKLFDENKGEPT